MVKCLTMEPNCPGRDLLSLDFMVNLGTLLNISACLSFLICNLGLKGLLCVHTCKSPRRAHVPWSAATHVSSNSYTTTSADSSSTPHQARLHNRINIQEAKQHESGSGSERVSPLKLGDHHCFEQSCVNTLPVYSSHGA